MIARIVLDVANVPPRPIALILIGWFIVLVLLEGGILTLMGLRPIGKAFTTSFLVNVAAWGCGVVAWLIISSTGLESVAVPILTALVMIAVQGLVLSTNRVNLTRGRAWLAALLMKGGTFALSILILQVMDF
jgi:hypothetical protein